MNCHNSYKEKPDRFTPVDNKNLIYRGGQPDENHLQLLQDMGIKNIINLRKENLIAMYCEKNLCKTMGINYYSCPLYGIFGIEPSFINNVVDLMNTLGGSCYIHCKHGRDRTSIMVAAYLVKYCGKDPDAAWTEDVIAFGHDENSIYYSQFKSSFYIFCESLR